jgi:hypothetical protein
MCSNYCCDKNYLYSKLFVPFDLSLKTDWIAGYVIWKISGRLATAVLYYILWFYNCLAVCGDVNCVISMWIVENCNVSYYAVPRMQSKVFPVQAVEALRVARSWGSHIFRHSAHRWRQGCQLHSPAAFYPQEDSWYTFRLEPESTPGPYCGWKD